MLISSNIIKWKALFFSYKLLLFVNHLFLNCYHNKNYLKIKDGNSVIYLNCGFIPEVYPTIDFGAGENVKSSFDVQRSFAKKGPLV